MRKPVLSIQIVYMYKVTSVVLPCRSTWACIQVLSLFLNDGLRTKLCILLLTPFQDSVWRGWPCGSDALTIHGAKVSVWHGLMLFCRLFDYTVWAYIIHSIGIWNHPSWYHRILRRSWLRSPFKLQPTLFSTLLIQWTQALAVNMLSSLKTDSGAKRLICKLRNVIVIWSMLFQFLLLFT